MQPDGIPVTYACMTALGRDFRFKPGTSLHGDLRKFAEWYEEFTCKLKSLQSMEEKVIYE